MTRRYEEVVGGDLDAPLLFSRLRKPTAFGARVTENLIKIKCVEPSLSPKSTLTTWDDKL